MTPEEQYYYNKASQDVWYTDRQHESIMATLVTKQEMAFFESLKPALSKDGNQWCVLLGENLQEGVAGFGNTPYLAILDFNKQMQKP